MDELIMDKKAGAIKIPYTIVITVYFAFLVFTIWIDGFLYPGKHLNGLYLANIIFAGAVFWRIVSIQILITCILTFFYYFFAPFELPHILVIIFQGIIYSLAIIGVSIAIKYYKREKDSTLSLTFTMAKSLDSRDPYTAMHSKHVAYYSYSIAREMKLKPKQCNDIHVGGLLHDMGKIGIPDSILTKPSKLTNQEYEKIKQHPVIGYEMVKHIPVFQKNGILDIIMYHHERFDGKGYPNGLKGHEIPLVARIVAVADTFDAMISGRAYRSPVDLKNVLMEIRNNSGSQFDENIAELFINLVEKGKIQVLSLQKSKIC